MDEIEVGAEPEITTQEEAAPEKEAASSSVETPVISDAEFYAQAAARGYVPAAPVAVQDDPLESQLQQIADLQYSDPVGAERLRMEIATKQAISQLAPYVQRQNAKDVVQDIAGDLSASAQAYVRQFAPQLDPTRMSPMERDLLRNAAENVERKAEPSPRLTVESAHSEPAITISDPIRREAIEMARMAGLPAPTDKEIAEMMSA